MLKVNTWHHPAGRCLNKQPEIKSVNPDFSRCYSTVCAQGLLLHLKLQSPASGMTHYIKPLQVLPSEENTSFLKVTLK